ncbi:peptidoglycan-binding domain-containing protein [Catellatospora paridis]|uniref:peptidoglycan-binding domain-containing protein n=1 Tax=Catellatospora paridis TaxID=1617086 RepID=UPI0018AF6DD6|nr:peptidoglycan-binding domain-containing protein [Catellatospora paridis]
MTGRKNAASAAATFTLMLISVLTLVSSPANAAATPHCNGTLQSSGLRVPAYVGKNSTVFCLMTIGTRGTSVKQLQTSLNRCYKQRLQVDGQYGPLTKAAVRTAQRTERMDDQDGVYGPDTAVTIMHVTVQLNLCGYQ